MVVNSIVFWVFFICIIVPYYTFLKCNHRLQNSWLLLGSYFFYGWAEWKMLPLLIAVTIIYFYFGILIEKSVKDNPKTASLITTIGVVLGVCVLFYFKYLGFCIQEFASLFSRFGLNTNEWTFSIIMPLGISFFTFKLISYVIEIHRENISATKDIIAFGTYVSFFPTIMSGPIDRPGEFLGQLNSNRLFKYEDVTEGVRRVVYGMFMKMCIADLLQIYTSAVFSNYSHHNATTLIIASILYAFEMYTDFCGYSNMAIGVSQIMGLRVRENFNRPFLAQNVAEYWRRWHMSLTTWITDYIFMPLNVAFRNIGIWGLYLATLLNLLIIGIWHGANWTYVLFGVYHGLLLIIVTAVEKTRKKFEKHTNVKKKSYYKYSRRFITFVFCTIGFLIFRSPDISTFFGIIRQMCNGFGAPFIGLDIVDLILPAFVFLPILIVKEINDENQTNIHFLHSDKTLIRVISLAIMISAILYVGNFDSTSFIYFQF